MEVLKGTGVAMVTPFKENKEVDHSALKNLVEHLIQGGVEYLVVLGTTGETATLSAQEQKAVIETVISANQKRLPLVLGMGGNNTAALKEQLNQTDLSDFTAILSASPYYNKPSQEGIYQHYKALAETTDKPIILYNVPGRTASNISAKTCLRLAHDFENIIGVKEASADLDQVMAIIQYKPEDFIVISGEDGLTFPIVACGGAGVISVVANAYPHQFSEMVRLTLNGKIDPARSIHYSLKKMIDLLFQEGNPGGIKAALANMQLCEDKLRMPLWPVSEELKEKIKSEMNLIARH